MVISIPDPYRAEVGVYSYLSSTLLRVAAQDSLLNLLRKISLYLTPRGKALGVSLLEADIRPSRKNQNHLWDNCGTKQAFSTT